jgi:small-conductance mechanosensitive channel
MDETRAALLQAISSIADVTIETEERVPPVLLVGFGASAVDWIVCVWATTKDFSATRDRLVYTIKKQLDAAKIALAFPLLDIHIDSSSNLQDVVSFPNSTCQIPRCLESLKLRGAAQSDAAQSGAP